VSVERERVRSFGRLEDGLRQASDWYLWGPYLSERQWGTVREDYSDHGDAWDYFPHDHARSRAYRWGEDGLAGFSDVEQRLCLSLALWNGRDPVLKERAFGLTGEQGNHGEDVKEYWWYLDSVPTHAWNRWRYHYPQVAFPYEQLEQENARRTRADPEYELLDTGVFDDNRYWVVEVVYAKAGPETVLMEVRVTNVGPDAEELHLLPTLWFRNTWSWDEGDPSPWVEQTGPAKAGTLHPFLGRLELVGSTAPDGAAPELLFCDNETNLTRLYGVPSKSQYPKDGINDHVTAGASTVNPDHRGTKCAFWYRLTVPGGGTATVRLRLGPQGSCTSTSLQADFDDVLRSRGAEADEFYGELLPKGSRPGEAEVMRQAFAGLLWGKQFYCYDVARWLDGDPTQPSPPSSRLNGRNARWRNFDSYDILSMPDKWEYPWFAAWDLAFHCVALAHVDPGFAKYQLALLCREWFQHPNGAIPAYEWDFGDVNPPVHAWAALEVFDIDGQRDVDFLTRIFAKLLINFTWWVNREDASGSNLFGGGFLGLDNIGPIDRSHLPPGTSLEQSDATGWMAFYSLGMATIAYALDNSGKGPTTDLVLKFVEHFAAIRQAIDDEGMWDETDGLFYDRLVLADGSTMPMEVRSMVSIIPVLAAGVVDSGILQQAEQLGKQFSQFLERVDIHDPTALSRLGLVEGGPGNQRLLLGIVSPDRLQRLLTRLFDEAEFLSPYGLRSLSAYHRDHPYELTVEGSRSTIDYEPAESTTTMFGGNSNWRGPVWFPLNCLVISALERYYDFFGQDLTFEYPTGSGRRLALDAIARDLRSRLISIFVTGPDGRRPCFGAVERLQVDANWKDNIIFSEYFHGDFGWGLGASHQTGWTGMVADAIVRPSGTAGNSEIY
jgi:hypothetical protein